MSLASDELSFNIFFPCIFTKVLNINDKVRLITSKLITVQLCGVTVLPNFQLFKC